MFFPELPRSIKFILTGIINTLAGNGLIFFLIFMGVMPELSNVFGYCVGLCISFVLNRLWVFRAREGKIVQQGMRFLLCFFVAFLLNISVLSFCFRILNWHPYISQGIASLLYTAVFYFLNKYITFSSK